MPKPRNIADFTAYDETAAELAALPAYAGEERAVLEEVADAELALATTRGTDPVAFLGEEF